MHGRGPLSQHPPMLSFFPESAAAPGTAPDLRETFSHGNKREQVTLTWQTRGQSDSDLWFVLTSCLALFFSISILMFCCSSVTCVAFSARLFLTASTSILASSSHPTGRPPVTRGVAAAPDVPPLPKTRRRLTSPAKPPPALCGGSTPAPAAGGVFVTIFCGSRDQ